MQKTKRYYFFYKNYNTRNKINKKNIITLQKTKYSKTIDYLENISPKPEAYSIAFEKKRETEALMEKILEEKEFEIERATNLTDWETAAEYLRELCAMIPDKHDARHIKYNRQLLQVEARINKTR